MQKIRSMYKTSRNCTNIIFVSLYRIIQTIKPIASDINKVITHNYIGRKA